jgi:hypothetical protein
MLPTPDTKISCTVLSFKKKYIRFWELFEATTYVRYCGFLDYDIMWSSQLMSAFPEITGIHLLGCMVS